MPPPALMLAAAIVTALAAAAGCFLARGTTAVPAAAWAVVAAAALAGESAALAVGWLTEPSAAAATRLIVAALAVCPAASLLGAKRPQHGVWQFIVATLAGVLMLPAVSAVLVRPGSMPDVHMIERVLLVVLVVVGWLNFVATRHGLAATLVAGGQLALIWPVVRGFADATAPAAWLDAVGGLAVACGAVLAVGQSLWRPAAAVERRGEVAGAIERPFLALRETLGAAWTLRITERFNTIASSKGWPCRLMFAGIVLDKGAAGGPWEREAVRCCRSILRRFVTPAWLGRQGGMRLQDAGTVDLTSSGPSPRSLASSRGQW
jgi:hypothetical protein